MVIILTVKTIFGWKWHKKSNILYGMPQINFNLSRQTFRMWKLHLTKSSEKRFKELIHLSAFMAQVVLISAGIQKTIISVPSTFNFTGHQRYGILYQAHTSTNFDNFIKIIAHFYRTSIVLILIFIKIFSLILSNFFIAFQSLKSPKMLVKWSLLFRKAVTGGWTWASMSTKPSM